MKKYDKLEAHFVALTASKTITEVRQTWKPYKAILENDFTCPCGQKHVTNTVDIINIVNKKITRIGIDCCENLFGYTLGDERRLLSRYRKQKKYTAELLAYKYGIQFGNKPLRLMSPKQLQNFAKHLTNKQYITYNRIITNNKQPNNWEYDFIISVHFKLKELK